LHVGGLDEQWREDLGELHAARHGIKHARE
jgi:hypothetical protein